MLVGRTAELDYLESLFRKGGLQCLILYGPYRAGKTELLKRFSKGRTSFFFTSAPCNKRDQLEHFREQVMGLTNDGRLRALSRFSWKDMFQYVFDKLGKKLSMVVIDEFAHLCEEDPTLPAVLRKVWEEKAGRHNILFVISSSDVPFVKDVLLKKKGLFSGKDCGILELPPLRFEAISSFFPDYSIQDKVYCYAALGGLPGYLRVFDRKRTLEQNIKEEAFNKDSILFQEPPLLLQSRLREPSLYFSILRAIALGKNRLSEIAGETGLRRVSTLNKYLYVLRNLHFIKRIVPVTDEDAGKSRKGMYYFREDLFRFWFRYVFPNLSYLEIQDKDIVWRQYLKPDIDNFIRETFVEICIQRLERLNRYSRLPFEARRIGRWWDQKDVIDIVGLSDREEFLFCDCHWDNKKAGLVQLKELRRKSRKFPKSGRKIFALFSKSGYTKDLKDRARESDGVLLLPYY